jgi:hypothetical protein
MVRYDGRNYKNLRQTMQVYDLFLLDILGEREYSWALGEFFPIQTRPVLTPGGQDGTQESQ